MRRAIGFSDEMIPESGDELVGEEVCLTKGPVIYYGKVAGFKRYNGSKRIVLNPYVIKDRNGKPELCGNGDLCQRPIEKIE